MKAQVVAGRSTWIGSTLAAAALVAALWGCAQAPAAPEAVAPVGAPVITRDVVDRPDGGVDEEARLKNAIAYLLLLSHSR